MTTWTDGPVRVLVGDVRARLAELANASVQCVVTSPPYWGLRDYGAPGQLGLEPTPEEFVCAMVEVFHEARRVLRADGTLWLNLGDSYAHGGNGARDAERWPKQSRSDGGDRVQHAKKAGELKPKDLAMLPAEVALALRRDGWWLRSDIIWAKPNPMPESVTDRPTTAHEHVFLLTRGTWVGPPRLGVSLDWARWLAALIDGEGTITIGQQNTPDRPNPSYYVAVSIANTNRSLLDKAREVTGVGNVMPSGLGTNRPLWRWQVTCEQAASVLWSVRDCLIAKRRQCEIALALQDVNFRRGGIAQPREVLAYKERLWSSIKELNQGGDPDLLWVQPPRGGRWVGGDYFYDAEAVREPVTGNAHPCGSGVNPKATKWPSGWDPDDHGRAGNGRFRPKQNESWSAAVTEPVAGRNLRSVWSIATQPYPEAHFATFPEELARRCIAAGTSERGCCPECGAPWLRVVEREKPSRGGKVLPNGRDGGLTAQHGMERTGLSHFKHNEWLAAHPPQATGWQPRCSHSAEPVPCIVLDPFAGSGTTLAVARRMGRAAVGIELQPDYLPLIRRRVAGAALPLLEAGR